MRLSSARGELAMGGNIHHGMKRRLSTTQKLSSARNLELLSNLDWGFEILQKMYNFCNQDSYTTNYIER